MNFCTVLGCQPILRKRGELQNLGLSAFAVSTPKYGNVVRKMIVIKKNNDNKYICFTRFMSFYFLFHAWLLS